MLFTPRPESITTGLVVPFPLEMVALKVAVSVVVGGVFPPQLLLSLQFAVVVPVHVAEDARADEANMKLRATRLIRARSEFFINFDG